MAGSYRHVVTRKKGKLRERRDLLGMLETSSGDVYEAVEEMYGMIWLLADAIAVETGQETKNVVEEARKTYTLGLELSPGVKK